MGSPDNEDISAQSGEEIENSFFLSLSSFLEEPEVTNERSACALAKKYADYLILHNVSYLENNKKTHAKVSSMRDRIYCLNLEQGKI